MLLNDVARVTNGLHMRRPKKKANILILNETRIKPCIARFDAGVCTLTRYTSSDSNDEPPSALELDTTTSVITTSSPSVSAPASLTDTNEVCLIASHHIKDMLKLFVLIRPIC